MTTESEGVDRRNIQRRLSIIADITSFGESCEDAQNRDLWIIRIRVKIGQS